VEEHIGLGRLRRSWHRDVRLLELHRVDVLEGHEVLDVDRGAPPGPDPIDLLVRDQDDVALLGFVAPHEVLPGHGALGLRRGHLVGSAFGGPRVVGAQFWGIHRRLFHDPALPDPPSLPVVEVEPDVLRLGARDQPDRDRHQAEAQRPGPHRRRHGRHSTVPGRVL
jgi:hypothetical protein